MNNPLTNDSSRKMAIAGVAMACAVTALAGCAVRVVGPPPPPPPRVVYVPPPPPPAPAVDVQLQANDAPPPLPDYEQPPCPEEGYLWTPGYWGWAGGGYYWVPGTWVQPPVVGVLWTPGYWGFVGGVYRFNAGYWGPHVGFYGGVNYGFGYVGVGFAGGHWAGGSFNYNRSVTNVNVTVVHNTYNETVVNNTTINKTSFNGGPGGVAAQPSAAERTAAAEPHTPPTASQRAHVQEASRNPDLAAKANGGHPAIAATPRPGAFHAAGVVGARGAPPAGTAHPQAAQQNQAGGAHPPVAQQNQPGARPAATGNKPPPKSAAKPAPKKAPPQKREEGR